MKTAEETIKASTSYPPDDAAVEELADIVGAILHQITAPIGTGKLIGLILPGCTVENPNYRLSVTALQHVRKREDCQHMWEYTGKKNHFGKPALRWLPQF
jgi:hypothetical protein